MNYKEMSKSRMLLVLLSLFLSTSCTMGDMVIVPIASNLYEIFPQVALVNAIISAPALVGVPFCILGGQLADKMNKKTLMVYGFALYTFTSIFGCVFENVYYMLICRLISTGVSWGITSAAALGIIAELYADEGKRGMVNGWYNAVMAAIGALMSFIAGILAVNAWQKAFHTYWINLPILIMLIVFLPSMPSNRSTQQVTEVSNNQMKETGWYKNLIPLLIQVLMVASSYYVIVYMVSLYVSDTGIGNEAFTGTLSSAGTICSFLANMAFGFIYGKLKRNTGIPSCIVLGIGFLLLAFYPSKITALIMCGIMGAFWGIFYSFFFTECSIVVPKSKQGISIGITSAVNGIAMFICTYEVTGLQSILKSSSITSIFPILGGICLIAAIFAILINLKKAKSTVN